MSESLAGFLFVVTLAVALGETDDGDLVLELNVGQTALAFFLPVNACRMLGQALLTLAASRSQLSN